MQNAIMHVTVAPLGRVSDEFKILKTFVNPFKHGIHLNDNQEINSYLTESTLRLHYKDQTV
jgi:hypothetical protein